MLAAYKAAVQEDGWCYHLHDPELFTLALLLRFQGKKVVFDWHEDLPEQVLGKDWIPKVLRRPTAWLARFLRWIANSSAHGLVAATPEIARKLPTSKTFLVQNYPLSEESVLPDPLPYTARDYNLVYTGGIAVERGAAEMVKAIGSLNGELRPSLFLAGSFHPRSLLDELRSLPGWERTHFLGWIDRGSVLKVYSEARIGLVLFHPGPNHLRSQPNKLFEYMSAAIPVVASNFPHWRDIVKGAGCGLLVDPLDPRAIADAIEWLLLNPKQAEEMGQRGRQAVLDRYSWDCEAPKLLELYKQLKK